MIKGGPKIINDGLVLCLDAHDAKSYAGEPVTNLYGDMSTSTALRPNRTEYNTGGTWPTDMPMCPEPVGRVYKHTSGALTSSWSNNSYGYSYKDIATTSGETYICTCWVFVSIDSDIDYMYLGIEAYLSGAGIPSGYTQVYNLNNKGTWQLLALYVTADTNVRFLPVYPRHSGVTDGSFSGFYAWGGAQVVKANYVTPFVLSSRSATNGWLDRTTNNNDGTLTNMVGTGASHYRDGQVIMPVANSYLEFDGTNDYVNISFGNGHNPATNPISYTLWVKNHTSNGSEMFMVQGNWSSAARAYFGYVSGQWAMGIQGSGWGAGQGGDTITSNVWQHMTIVFDGSTCRWYRNGAEMFTKSYTSYAFNQTLDIGSNPQYENNSYAWDGEIAQVLVHNKALTAAEVLSNYNATKERF